MRAKPGVLLLCPDLGYGGAELSYARLSRLLASRYKVTCVAFNADIARYYELGGPLLVLDPSRAARGRSPLSRFFARAFALRRVRKAENPAITISFLEGADYINFFAGPQGRRYASIRGSKVSDGTISGLQGWLRKSIMMPLVYRRLDGVITVSAELKEEIATHFGVARERITAIPNFYDADHLAARSLEPLAPALEQAFSTHTVLTNVGRLHVHKNQEFLLHVIANLAHHDPDVRLCLIGDGPDREMLRARSTSLGLTLAEPDADGGIDATAKVWLMGYQANPHAYVARSRAFVFPSITEGFPNALVEAMLCGVPVVTSDCPTGPAEILAARAHPSQSQPVLADGGVLAPIGNADDPVVIQAWVKAIGMALTEKELGPAARVRAMNYAGGDAAGVWFRLIDEAAGRSR